MTDGSLAPLLDRSCSYDDPRHDQQQQRTSTANGHEQVPPRVQSTSSLVSAGRHYGTLESCGNMVLTPHASSLSPSQQQSCCALDIMGDAHDSRYGTLNDDDCDVRDNRNICRQDQGFTSINNNSIESIAPQESTTSGLRHWWRRFELLPSGGIAASGFNLASSTIDIGTLYLPAAMQSSGILLGSMFLALCCAGTVYSIRLLIITLEKTGYSTYEEMARKLVGPKFQKLTALMVITFCWGITVIYIVAMGDILTPITEVQSIPSVFHGIWGKRAITTIFWGIFMFPLSLAKEINTLRYASVVGFASTIILTSSMVTHAVEDKASLSRVDIANFDTTMILALPVIVFSYGCQTNAFEIYAEMKDRSVNKMTLATGLSMAGCTLIYIIAGSAGYSDFLNATHANILNNYNDPAETPYIAAAFLAVSITLTMAFPICIFPTRDAVLQMMGFRNAYETPWHIRVLVAGCLSFSSLLAGLFIPGIQMLLGVLGGICGTSLAFLFPAIFIWRTGEWTPSRCGWLNVLATGTLFSFGLAAGILGTTVSLLQSASS